MKILSLLIGYLLCIISASSLERLIEAEVPLTVGQQVIIFIYFLLVALVIFYFYRKKVINVKKNLFTKIAISLLFSVLMVTGSLSFLLKQYTSTTLELYSDYEEEFREENTIWISNIFVDGVSVNLGEFPVTEGWNYISDWDDLMSVTGKPSSLILQFPKSKEIKIRFVYYNSFENYTYVKDGGDFEPIRLVPGEENAFYYEVKSNHIQYTTMETLLYFFLFCSLFFSISFILFSFIFEQNKWAFWGILFFIDIKALHLFREYFDFSVAIFLFVLQIIFCIAAKEIKNSTDMQKYHTFKIKLIVLLFDFYASFAWVGFDLFLNGERIHASLESLSNFIFIMIYFYPILYLAIWMIEKGSAYWKIRQPMEAKGKKVFLNCFLLMTGILGTISLGFYPANMTSDGVSQWDQAVHGPIYNDHTPIHTILIRVLSKIWETPYMVVLFQIVMFSLILACFMNYFYKKGISVKVLYCFSVLIALAPNNYMMLTLASKNIPFTILLLWVLYLLLLGFDNINRYKKIRFIFAFSIAVALLNLIRKNSFLSVWGIYLILIGISIYYFKKVKIAPLVVIVASFFIIHFIEGPVYQYFDVQGENGSLAAKGPLLYPFAAMEKYKIELSEDAKEMMEQMAPLEQWGDCYNPYNTDSISFAYPPFQFENVSFGTVFKNYINLLFTHPDVVIKDRLDGINLLWNIVQPDNIYNHRYAIGIWPPDSLTSKELPNLLQDEDKQGEAYFKNNIIGNQAIKLAEYSTRFEIIDLFLWRNGIYILITFLLILIGAVNKKGKLLCLLIAPAATIVTFVLVMGWQIYQYLWFFSLTTFVSVFYALIDIKSLDKK